MRTATTTPAAAPMMAIPPPPLSLLVGGGGSGGGDGATTTACGKATRRRTEVVIPRPSAANLALSAVSRAKPSKKMLADIRETAEEAPSCVPKKMSAVTITEPAVSVRETALVVTSAAFARTVLMAVWAAAS